MAVTQQRQALRTHRTELIQDWFSRFGTVLVILALVVVFSLTTDHFFTTANMQNILRQIAITAIVGIGMTMVILIGGIDLSVGSVVLFSAAAMNSLIFNQ